MNWLWMLLIPAFAAVVYIERRYTRKIHTAISESWQYLRVLPKADHQLKVAETVQFLHQLWQFRRPDVVALRKGQSMFRSLFHKTSTGEVAWYLAVPTDRVQGFYAAFHAAFPSLEALEVNPEELEFLQRVHTGSMLQLAKRGETAGLPLSTLRSGDPLPAILYGMGAGQEQATEETVLDIVLSPASDRALRGAVRKAEQALNPRLSRTEAPSAAGLVDAGMKFGQEVLNELSDGKLRQRGLLQQNRGAQGPKWNELEASVQNQVQSVHKRYTGTEHAFHTWIRLGVCADPDDGRDQHLKSIGKARIQAMLGGFVGWSGHQSVIENWRFRGKRAVESIRQGPPPRGQEMLVTTEEAACLWHLPDSKSSVFQFIPAVRQHAKTLKEGELTEGVSLGALRHPTQSGRPVKLPFEQLTKHFVLSGQTGSGKSSELVEILDSQIQQWLQQPTFPGFSFIDPHQETIIILMTRLLNYGLTEEQWSKVHYISLASPAYPIGLNLLARRPGEDPDDVADDAMALIKYAYGGNTPQLDRILRNGLRTLLEDDSKAHSVAGLTPLFQDERWRSRVLRHVKDPVVRMFWKNEFEGATSSIGPLMNRLSPFISNKTMRRMFGQPSFMPEIRKYMDEGHIFFWDVLGVNPERMRLGVGLLINQYYKVGKSRPLHSMPHLLVADEAHLVQVPVLEKIQAETRKYGLSLGLSTQFIEQFEDWLQKSIMDIVGNIFSCSLGTNAASVVSSMTNGHFDKSYLQNLPERTVGVYTKVDRKVRSLEVEAAPPYMYLSNWQQVDFRDKDQVQEATTWALDKARELQKRDAQSAEEVDKELDSYLSTETALRLSEEIPDDVFHV
ncbi:ATP-binding protein [Alicyclobacillus sp. SO9]|uniref:ATP-binding protein n=1 Tax=Alicyclobacillus sp. SO9 TaxID=2665646 RepID=UPI0018E82B86|nr:ATP-binding protein [Alicyclobacillus sp. SO9]QQE79725.1 ATP-binding protein [Alicyclobacillus sp. SO9]